MSQILLKIVLVLDYAFWIISRFPPRGKLNNLMEFEFILDISIYPVIVLDAMKQLWRWWQRINFGHPLVTSQERYLPYAAGDGGGSRVAGDFGSERNGNATSLEKVFGFLSSVFAQKLVLVVIRILIVGLAFPKIQSSKQTKAELGIK